MCKCALCAGGSQSVMHFLADMASNHLLGFSFICLCIIATAACVFLGRQTRFVVGL